MLVIIVVLVRIVMLVYKESNASKKSNGVA